MRANQANDGKRTRTHSNESKRKHTMTYEEFLDEVTTLLTELYDLDDAAAIKLVVDAQEAEFFTLHDDLPAMRTLEQAKQDAVTLFEQKQNRQRTQVKQQQRQQQRSLQKKAGRGPAK